MVLISFVFPSWITNEYILLEICKNVLRWNYRSLPSQFWQRVQRIFCYDLHSRMQWGRLLHTIQRTSLSSRHRRIFLQTLVFLLFQVWWLQPLYWHHICEDNMTVENCQEILLKGIWLNPEFVKICHEKFQLN